MDEVWKPMPISGYEDLYEVSNYGRVKSLFFRNNHVVMRKEHILSATDNGHGYKIIGLKNGGKRVNFYVHRLVAMAFIPNPDNLPVVDHIDHDRSNNRVDNLQWMTQKDNVRRSVEQMSKPRSVATSNTGHKYISKIANGKFRVAIVGIGFYRTFATLEEAVAAKEEAIGCKERALR